MDLNNIHTGAKQAALITVSLKSFGLEAAVFELGQVLGREPLARRDEQDIVELRPAVRSSDQGFGVLTCLEIVQDLQDVHMQQKRFAAASCHKKGQSPHVVCRKIRDVRKIGFA